jgi:hypothetical protein
MSMKVSKPKAPNPPPVTQDTYMIKELPAPRSQKWKLALDFSIYCLFPALESRSLALGFPPVLLKCHSHSVSIYLHIIPTFLHSLTVLEVQRKDLMLEGFSTLERIIEFSSGNTWKSRSVPIQYFMPHTYFHVPSTCLDTIKAACGRKGWDNVGIDRLEITNCSSSSNVC